MKKQLLPLVVLVAFLAVAFSIYLLDADKQVDRSSLSPKGAEAPIENELPLLAYADATPRNEVDSLSPVKIEDSLSALSTPELSSAERDYCNAIVSRVASEPSLQRPYFRQGKTAWDGVKFELIQQLRSQGLSQDVLSAAELAATVYRDELDALHAIYAEELNRFLAVQVNTDACRTYDLSQGAVTLDSPEGTFHEVFTGACHDGLLRRIVVRQGDCQSVDSARQYCLDAADRLESAVRAYAGL